MPAKKRKTSKKPEPYLPSPIEIVAHLDKYIIGQSEAKRSLASACYCHVYNCSTVSSLDDKVWTDNNVLIAGPSGCGKSEAIRVICDFLGLPCYQVDCTSISATGYKGLNVDKIVRNLEEHFVNDGLSPVASIVVWDEIDKLLDDGSEAGSYRRMAQTDLLRLLEGAKVCDELNTSRILHLACGAFVGLDEILHPKQISEIGFVSHEISKDTKQERPDGEIEAEHFVEVGMVPELVGRFSRFVEMKALNVDDMAGIMTDSKISFLGRKVEQYKQHGTSLVFSDDAVRELARLAINHPAGARGLRQLISHALEPWDFQLADLQKRGIHEIHYDASTIHDGTKAHIVMGAPSAPTLTRMPNDLGLLQNDDTEGDDYICIF